MRCRRGQAVLIRDLVEASFYNTSGGWVKKNKNFMTTGSSGCV